MFDSRRAFFLPNFFEELRHYFLIDIEQGNQGARAGNILHQNALTRALEIFVAKPCQGHADERDIVAEQIRIEWPRGVVNQVTTGADLGHVARIRLRVHRNHQVILRRTRGVSVFVDTDFIPRGQPLNIRREQILAGDGHAHPEDRLHDQAIGAGGPGPVYIGQLDGKVVYAATHDGVGASAPA